MSDEAGTQTNGAAESSNGAQTVLASTHERVRNELEALKRVSAREKEAWSAEKATIEQRFTAELAQLAQSWQEKEAAWGEERAVMAAGISDPEGVDYARVAWSRLPQDKRPSGGLSEWLKMTDALPRAVQAYLPSATQAPQNAPPSQGASMPNSNGGTVQASPTGGKLTIEQIRSLPLEKLHELLPGISTGKI